MTCACGPFECSCRWRADTAESYGVQAWPPVEAQSYTAYAPPPQTLPHYETAALPADEIFHPEEIFQLDQPIRLDFPMEENTLESPPTFQDLNENSRPEDTYWIDWQREPESESSETPSPELFGNYQQTEAYCEQQAYIPQMYYQEEGQYYPTESTRLSPAMDVQEQRFYRYDQDCTQTNSIDYTQVWNYNDCAFPPSDNMSECKQYFDVQHQQAVNAYGGLL